jgi:YidC/Oxa1 family membrane protein insertase
MMKLYKENGTSPFGACLPSLLQMPFLIVLYSLIRGLGYTVKGKHGKIIPEPRYIPIKSEMHAHLVASGGQMHSWFGMDLSSSPFTHHGSNQALLIIPYLVLIGMAIFLQYYQMKQMNSRNPQAAAANPQMQQMQKFFPIIFGVIYLRVPAGATIYMVVSSAMRIGTQEFMFRTGMVTPVGAAVEREIGGSSEPPPKTAGSAKALGTGSAKPTGATGRTPAKSTTPPKGTATPKNGSGANAKAAANGKPPGTVRRTTNGRANNGKGAAANRAGGANGKKPSEDAEVEFVPVPKEHPRSRSKRTRKAR